jgi:CPA1 family monovalent cation:H+ antiporter
VDIETAFVLLFVVATAVAIAARRLRMPYTVALVVAGLVLGSLDLFPAPRLTKALLFGAFLPGLIFEAAFHIRWPEFRDNLITILSLAVPGVIASTALIAVALTPVLNIAGLLPGFGWKDALVFGALISATDPVAVVALFRNLGAPRRLTMLLDSESLLNDGTAIVFFTLSLSLLSGTAVTAGQLSVQFVSIVGIGAVIGATIGAAASLVMRQIDDPMIEICLTTIAAYGSFVTAETLQASGVIATVAAGMLCGNFGSRVGMSAASRVASRTFWEYTAFALNSIVFLLIGFEVHLRALFSHWLPILAAYLIVTIGRGLVIVGARALLGLTRERFPWRWTIVLTWGGLRGALPMVLVLSLPATFVYRQLLISMTFGVAVLSILVHGLTMSGLLRWLGITSDPGDRIAYEVRLGRLQSAAAALQEIERLSRMHLVAPEVLDGLRVEYQHFLETAEQELRELPVNARQLQQHDLQRIRRHLLDTERDQVIRASNEGTLSHKSQERLLADIEARCVQPAEGQADPNSPEAAKRADTSNELIPAATEIKSPLRPPA